MTIEDPDPTTRFSNRVADYVRYRPGYPPGALDAVREATGLTSAHAVADVGSGTGLSARLFLDNGNRVAGVEPNEAMRHAAEETLHAYEGFTSIEGAAEATGLRDASIDVIVAAQAFHWFDRDAVRREFARVLRPDGWVVLMWNERRLDATPFLREYEALLIEFATDYERIRHENVTDDMIREFLASRYSRHAVYNEQVFDLEGLRGRVLSASYMPAEGQPGHGAMLEALDALFEEHARDGRVVVEYDTVVHCGQL